ncbi:serine hydrolase domain-containing protein [Bacteroidota bacterium]
MNNSKLKVWILLASIFLFAINCSRTPKDNNISYLQENLPHIIEKQMQDWHIPGLAVGIVKDDEVIFMKGFGYRDREKKLPVTTKTIFPIASCSKSFTALSAYMMIEDSLIKLDRPLKEYMPDFQMYNDSATSIATLRHFLAHRSGLGPNSIMPYLSGASGDEVFKRLKYFEPSGVIEKRLEYSNLGYSIAGRIVGKVKSMSWEDFVTERIFKPLRMKNACFSMEDITKDGDYAISYVNFMDDQPVRFHDRRMTAYSPAGGIACDIEGMVSWLMFNLNEGKVGRKQLITPKNHRLMYQSVTKLSWPDDSLWTEQSIAYGWMNEKYRGHTSIYHGGLGDGFISRVSFMPEEKIGVVVLTNMYYHLYEQAITYEIYDMLLGISPSNQSDRMNKECKEAVKAYRNSYNAFWDNSRPDTVSTEYLAKYTGKYSNPLYGQVSIYQNEEGLNISFESGLKVALHYYSENRLATEDKSPDYSHIVFEFEFSDEFEAVAFTVPLEGGAEAYRFIRSF